METTNHINGFIKALCVIFYILAPMVESTIHYIDGNIISVFIDGVVLFAEKNEQNNIVVGRRFSYDIVVLNNTRCSIW